MTNNDIVPGFDIKKDTQVHVKLTKVSELPQALLCVVSGQLDSQNSRNFQYRLEQCVPAGFRYIIFDLSQLQYASSTGIGAFVFILKAIKAAQGETYLASVQHKTREVFQLLGFTHFFNFANSVLEAKKDLISKVSPKTLIPAFPKIIVCVHCSQKLRAVKAGRFRCKKCLKIIQISSEGVVSF